MKRFIEYTACAVSLFAVSLLIVWIFVNTVTQCGEITRTVNGGYIHGECVLYPFK